MLQQLCVFWVLFLSLLRLNVTGTSLQQLPNDTTIDSIAITLYEEGSPQYGLTGLKIKRYDNSEDVYDNEEGCSGGGCDSVTDPETVFETGAKWGHSALTPASMYTYMVHSDCCGRSIFQVSLCTRAAPPLDVSAVLDEVNGRAVSLRFRKNPVNGDQTNGFIITSSPSTPYEIFPPSDSATSVYVTNLKPGTDYTFTVVQKSTCNNNSPDPVDLSSVEASVKIAIPALTNEEAEVEETTESVFEYDEKDDCSAWKVSVMVVCVVSALGFLTTIPPWVLVYRLVRSQSTATVAPRPSQQVQMLVDDSEITINNLEVVLRKI